MADGAMKRAAVSSSEREGARGVSEPRSKEDIFNWLRKNGEDEKQQVLRSQAERLKRSK